MIMGFPGGSEGNVPPTRMPYISTGSWEAQSKAVAVALNQKVVDKFFKGLRRGEGARQGSWPQRPVSPLLPREVDHFLPPFFFFFSMAENMICAVNGDSPPSTSIASPIVYLTAS